MKKVLKKNSAIRDGKKGLKQDADVQRGALLLANWYTNIAHQSELGIQKCTALDVSILLRSFLAIPNSTVFL